MTPSRLFPVLLILLLLDSRAYLTSAATPTNTNMIEDDYELLAATPPAADPAPVDQPPPQAGEGVEGPFLMSFPAGKQTFVIRFVMQ